MDARFLVQCITSAPKSHGLGKAYYIWASRHQAQWLILDMVKMV